MPFLKWSKRQRILVVGATACSIVLAGGAYILGNRYDNVVDHFQNSDMTRFDTNCLGRFTIDLPGDAARSGEGGFEYDFIEIKKVVRSTRSSYDEEVGRLLARLKAAKHDVEPSLLRYSDSTSDHSTVIAYREEPFIKAAVRVDGHSWIDGHHISVTTEAATNKQGIGVDAIRDLLARMRPRADREVPTEAGFCFQDGFIAGDVEQGEEVWTGFDLALNPDVHISVTIFPLAAKARDKPLLSRVDNLFKRFATLANDTTILRAGDRSLAGFPGQEYLVVAPNERQQRAHLFTWETQGNGTLDTPFVEIQMTSANPEEAGNARPASLTDRQALELWDRVVGSFRVRPTIPPAPKVSAAPSPVPLGEFVATGRPCPQTGWWESVEASAPVKGGRRQYFRAGDAMPLATLVGERSWSDRLKGEHPEHRVATVWQLVEHGAKGDQPSPPPPSAG